MRQGDGIAKIKGLNLRVGVGAGAGAGVGFGAPRASDPKGQAIASPSHVAEWLADEQLGYDAVLLCAHTRAYALRGAALSLVPDPGAFSSTQVPRPCSIPPSLLTSLPFLLSSLPPPPLPSSLSRRGPRV